MLPKATVSCHRSLCIGRNIPAFIEDIAWLRGDTKFLFECWKIFHEWAQHHWHFSSAPKNLHLVAQVLPNSDLNFEPCKAFFQVPTLEFEHNARKKNCVHRVPVCTAYLLVLGQPTALYLLRSTCSKVAPGRAKWSNYEHSHTDCILKVWTQCHLLPIPRNWFPGTKYEQPLNSI